MDYTSIIEWVCTSKSRTRQRRVSNLYIMKSIIRFFYDVPIILKCQKLKILARIIKISQNLKLLNIEKHSNSQIRIRNLEFRLVQISIL